MNENFNNDFYAWTSRFWMSTCITTKSITGINNFYSLCSFTN